MATKHFTNNGLGRIYYAPADTTVPTTVSAIVTAVTATQGSFKEIGEIHEDGLTITPRSVDSELKNWNGDVKEQSVHAEWKFKNLDFVSEDAVKVAYGADNVTGSGSDRMVAMDGVMPDAFVLVAVMKDGDKGVCAVLRNGRCKAVDDYSFKKGDYSVHGMTVVSEKPSDNGSCSYFAFTSDLDGDSEEE